MIVIRGFDLHISLEFLFMLLQGRIDLIVITAKVGRAAWDEVDVDVRDGLTRGFTVLLSTLWG